jgi:hypothetical protein
MMPPPLNAALGRVRLFCEFVKRPEEISRLTHEESTRGQTFGGSHCDTSCFDWSNY